MRAALFLAVCEGMSLVAQAARSESRIDPQRWPTTIFPSICAQQEAGGAFALTTAPFLLLRDDQPRETALAEPAAPHRQPTCPRRPGLGQADHPGDPQDARGWTSTEQEQDQSRIGEPRSGNTAQQ